MCIFATQQMGSVTANMLRINKLYLELCYNQRKPNLEDSRKAV